MTSPTHPRPKTLLHPITADLLQQMQMQRLRKGITLRQLEALTGIGNGYISKLEQGLIPPNLNTISRILSAMEATIQVKDLHMTE